MDECCMPGCTKPAEHECDECHDWFCDDDCVETSNGGHLCWAHAPAIETSTQAN
jgi:hypothetical protein